MTSMADDLTPELWADMSRAAALERRLDAEDPRCRTSWLAALAIGSAGAWGLLDRGLARSTPWAKHALVDALRVPEAWAWRYLHDRYAAPLRARAMKVLGSAHDAEACAADILFDFVTHYVHRPNALSFPGYLWAMATDYPLKRLRRERRQIPPEEAGPDREDDGRAWQELEHRLLLGRTRLSRLQAALGRLNEPERELLKMRMFDELSFSHIGRLRGCSAQNAQQSLERLLKRLREEVGLAHEDLEETP